MIGEFDSAVQRVAAKRDGNGVTPELFWEIVIALSHDIQNSHRETMQAISEVNQNAKAALHRHVDLCHGPLRRDGDPPESDFSAERRQVWVMWGVGRKVGAVALGIFMLVMAALINFGVTALLLK